MSNKRISIFLIEDSELYSLMLDQKLKSIANYSLTTFESAEEAIKNLNFNPDLVILDYYLSGMNGMEALKKIKSINSKIPVIVLSSQKDIQTAMDILEAGAITYLSKKELGVEKLCDTINKISNNKKFHENNFILQMKFNKLKIFISIMLLGLLGLIISII